MTRRQCVLVGGGQKRYAALEVANTLFRVTFQLKNLRLADSIMKGVSHNLSPDSATPFSAFPMSQQVTYRFFEGRVAVFNELYVSPFTHGAGRSCGSVLDKHRVSLQLNLFLYVGPECVG